MMKHEVLLLTFLWSGANTSHIDATIFETSPNEALGFCPLIDAWVSRKNKAYAETGLQMKIREKKFINFRKQFASFIHHHYQ